MHLKKESKKVTSAQWLGQPVLVILKDGRYYIGMLSSMDTSGLTLSRVRSGKKIPSSTIKSKDKAQVSGLLSSLFGGGNRMAYSGATRGNTRNESRGLFGQMMPHIRIGMNMWRTIMPLMGLFKI
ncbi:LSm family protein [Paenibacillus pini]|uniref:hypothetical protein n=1 Tax=Paenibacillus pini TaxID=669461 RepID=UPI0006916D2C|nr:hypothetical protein [Paenibacillus pini]